MQLITIKAAIKLPATATNQFATFHERKIFEESEKLSSILTILSIILDFFGISYLKNN